MSKLDNKVAIGTGASKGIRAPIAQSTSWQMKPEITRGNLLVQENTLH